MRVRRAEEDIGRRVMCTSPPPHFCSVSAGMKGYSNGDGGTPTVRKVTAAYGTAHGVCQPMQPLRTPTCFRARASGVL